MNGVASMFVGISLGAAIIISIEYACYKLFSDKVERYRAVVVTLSCAFVIILILAIIARVTK